MDGLSYGDKDPERTLPIRVPIAAGESLASWMEALARRYDMPLRQILPALGIHHSSTSTEAFRLLHQIPAEVLRRVERQAGLEQGRLTHSVLDQYDFLRFDRWSRRAHHWLLWERSSGSRFCPRCLAESRGRWPVLWHLNWTFACLRHRVALAENCPECGRTPYSGENRYDHNPDPRRCSHTAPGRRPPGPRVPRCGGDLTLAAATPLPPGHPLLTAQRWITTMISSHVKDTERHVTVAGLEAPANIALAAAATLMRYIVLHDGNWSTRPLTNIPGPAGAAVGLDVPKTKWKSVATAYKAVGNPVLFATLATVAIDILLATDLDAAAESVRWLLPSRITSASQDSLVLTRFQNYSTGSPIVDAIALRAHAASMNTAFRLSYRTQNPVPRRPAGSRRGVPATGGWPFLPGSLTALPARLVPQCIWRPVADVLPWHTSHDTTAFRTAMAMALVRTGTFTEWEAIAMRLGLPVRLGHTVSSVWRRLGEAGYLTDVLTGIDRLAEVLLRDPPPIDYARRRWVFRVLPLVSNARLRRACHRADLITTARRRRFATMFLWETLTGGDIRLHPGSLVPRDPADRSEYASFCKAEATELADYLSEEAERHLLRHRIDEPITWQPRCQGIGPDGPDWSAPDPDMSRRLPGWISPSRQDTLRRSARDHTPRALRLLDHRPISGMKTVVRDLQCFASAPFQNRPPGGVVRQWLDRQDTQRLGRDALQRIQRVEARTSIALLEKTETNTYLLTTDAIAFLTVWLAFMDPQEKQHLRPWSNIAKDKITHHNPWWQAQTNAEIGQENQPAPEPCDMPSS